jgi:hypothetical protein
MRTQDPAVAGTAAEGALAAVLKVTGTVMLVALFAVFMPRTWMSATHAWLGLGPLPEGPIVDYLARSVSAIYAMTGAVCWLFSTDVRRYAPAIRFAAWLGVPAGGIFAWIDASAGLPRAWRLSEGPFILALSIVLIRLCRRVPR